MNEYYPEGWQNQTRENSEYMLSVVGLEKAKREEKILEGYVILCDNDHNMTVDLGCMKGIIPRQEGALGISEGTTRDIALISRVGRFVCFVVTDIKTDTNGRYYAILSRRRAQELCFQNKISSFCRGDVIDAKVTHLEKFGAFCDIGCGNIALMPIDSISVSRISHPQDRFYVGQNIKAIVSGIDENNRVTLSSKELFGTWEENAQNFTCGQTVSGIVRSVESYGIFVELAPNLAGLAEPKEDVFEGQRASVYIKSIIKEKMKIKLIIIDSFSSSTKPRLDYYFKGDKMTYFKYSPENCEKEIFTDFTE